MCVSAGREVKGVKGTRRHSPGGTDVKGADTKTKSHKSPNSLIQPPI